MISISKKPNRFFTLLELLVVVVILGFLITVVVVNITGRTTPSRLSKVQADFAAIKQAVRMFKIDNKRYPENLQELTKVNVDGKGPWIEEMQPDPWGNEYRYVYQKEGRYNIISYGADNQPGGESMNQDIDLSFFQNRDRGP